jgi:hypothetical protein
MGASIYTVQHAATRFVGALPCSQFHFARLSDSSQTARVVNVTTQAERALHQELVLRLKAYPVLILPIPNSIYFPARTEAERKIIARVIHQMKSTGMLLVGAPDFVLMWCGGAALVEEKRPATKTLFGKQSAGRPTAAQRTMAERAAELGLNHAYVTSWDELRVQMVAWGVPGAQR